MGITKTYQQKLFFHQLRRIAERSKSGEESASLTLTARTPFVATGRHSLESGSTSSNKALGAQAEQSSAASSAATSSSPLSTQDSIRSHCSNCQANTQAQELAEKCKEKRIVIQQANSVPRSKGMVKAGATVATSLNLSSGSSPSLMPTDLQSPSDAIRQLLHDHDGTNYLFPDIWHHLEKLGWISDTTKSSQVFVAEWAVDKSKVRSKCLRCLWPGTSSGPLHREGPSPSTYRHPRLGETKASYAG